MQARNPRPRPSFGRHRWPPRRRKSAGPVEELHDGAAARPRPGEVSGARVSLIYSVRLTRSRVTLQLVKSSSDKLLKTESFATNHSKNI